MTSKPKNDKPNTDSPLLAGIDWADREHAVCLLGEAGLEHATLPQHPRDVAQWRTQLRQRFGDRPLLVAVEQSRGALIHALLAQGDIDVYPVNPKQLARYREALFPSGAKSDPGDAELLALFLREHRDRLRVLRPDTVETRQIGRLAECRRKLVDERKRLVNRLRDELKNYFPLLIELFGKKLAAPLVLELLKRWPTLTQLRRAHPNTLRNFLKEQGVRNKDRQTELIEAVRAAVPLTKDPGIVEPAALYAQALARQIAQLNRSVQIFDEQLEPLVAAHPDQDIFRSVPGAGDAFVPRLIAAFGTDRQRYQAAENLLNYSGIAPVGQTSGRSRKIVKRRHCPKFLRQTFHEFADQARKWSPWSKAFYAMKRDQGMKPPAALRALAFKWIRILHRLWTTRETYSEDLYQLRLRKSKSPLIQYLQSA